MPPGDDPKDAAEELRVTDRRRFTSTGEAREEGEEPAEIGPAAGPAGHALGAASPAAAEAEVAAEVAAEAWRDEEASRPRRSGLPDLGIESVFLIFHQSALIALGATHPGGTPGEVDLAEARQAIAFLKVLEQKTRGNLSEDEAAMLRDLLSEAQMAYVQVARTMGGGAT